MLPTRTAVLRLLAGMALTAATASALAAQANQKPLPLKYVGPATVPAITAGDLMTRLYKYADDSMGGRPVGTPEHLKAVAYIAREVRRLGLKPGGANGSYYQDFPIYLQSYDPASTVSVDGRTFKMDDDFIPSTPASFTNVATIYVGDPTDPTTSIDSVATAGKMIIIRVISRTKAERDRADAFDTTAAYAVFERALAGSAGLIDVEPDSEYPNLWRGGVTSEEMSMTSIADAKTELADISVTEATAEAILGRPLASAQPGVAGKPLTLSIRRIERMRTPGRNVIAILPGSDPKLKGEYVAIGAHSDHIGRRIRSEEHDSLKAYNEIAQTEGAERTGRIVPNAEQWGRINAIKDSLRKIYPERMDSINNGADDDGSGTVSVLEIAEAFAKGNVKPKRSILFVWHAGEERGMWGSGYYMDHPTVPRDSIVAQLNIDMVGRGAASDVTGQAKDGTVLHGSSGYLQLVGSRRLSTELGDLVESVNTTGHHDLTFDYSEDADGHPQDIYCRSDHWSYAKWNIPVVFFTTGGHADYHQTTDEPQYIQYRHMARVDHLIFDVVRNIADLDHRVVVDHAKPNPLPAATCEQ